MLRRPRRLVALAVLLLTLAPVVLPPEATVSPAQAATYEGRRVTVAGALVDARVFTDGSALLTLRADGHAVEVRADDPGVPRGTWLEASGVILRAGGSLRLWADSLHVGPPPEAGRPTWDQVARDPHSWEGRWIALEGIVDRGELQAHGHRLRLGDGAWTDGPVIAAGVLHYDAWCLCHRLHGAPWTP